MAIRIASTNLPFLYPPCGDVGDVVAQVKEFEVNAGDLVANEENRGLGVGIR